MTPRSTIGDLLRRASRCCVDEARCRRSVRYVLGGRTDGASNLSGFIRCREDGVRPSVRPFVCPTFHPPIRLFASPSVRPCVRPFVRPSAHMSTIPSSIRSFGQSLCATAEILNVSSDQETSLRIYQTARRGRAAAAEDRVFDDEQRRR